MAVFEDRDLHLVKKALCIGVLAIEQSPDSAFKPESDLADMKDLLDRL
ncbi:hypothetical protein [Sphingobium sp.]|nr:hypothetical protein [Sphingobium sp.]HUD92807.1 hypothetical protein [Sphingobium sp.]